MKLELVLVFLTASCTTMSALRKPKVDFPVDYAIDNSVSQSNVKKIVDVCEEWNQALEGRVFNCFSSDWFFFYPNQIKPIVAKEDVATLGVARIEVLGGSVYTTVFLDFENNRHDLKTVIRHELGHILGLGHKDGGFMNAFLSPRTVKLIDDKNVETVKKLNGW